MKYSCFVQMPCAKTPEFGIRRILGQYAGFLFYQRLVPKLQKAALFAIVCRFTAFAAFATGFCQKNSVSLCKGTKAPEFGIRRILTVRRFFFLQPAVWGFGLRLLISQGFLGAKAANETGIFFPEFSVS